MALGLGFGVAIGLWTEADDEAASSAPIETTPAANADKTVRPTVLGELRAQKPKLPTPGIVSPTEPKPIAQTAALDRVRKETVTTPAPAWLRNAVADCGPRPMTRRPARRQSKPHPRQTRIKRSALPYWASFERKNPNCQPQASSARLSQSQSPKPPLWIGYARRRSQRPRRPGCETRLQSPIRETDR